MRYYFYSFILLFLSSWLNADEQKTFMVKGLFSVGIPQANLEWTKLQDIKISDKNQETKLSDTEGEMYFCGKPTENKLIMLIVEKKKASRSSSRIVKLKDFYNEINKQFENIKVQIIEEKGLTFQAPVPDRVTCSLIFKKQNGDNIYLQLLFIFGENTYTFQVISPSKEESEKIITSLSNSFEELATNSHEIFTESGLFAIEIPRKGFVWKKKGQNNQICYECKKDGSQLSILLYVVEKEINQKEDQKKLLEYYAKNRIGQFIKDNLKIIQEPKVLLSPYDSTEGVFFIKAKSAQGNIIDQKCMAIFGKKSYVLEVYGPEKENPLALLNEIANSFKEL
ncbi:MAG TPA: hypothetical protein VIH42_03510 [Thermoguttaceae bacterium]